jgi:alpha-beta hydrolase superfamily lysophospholipase
MDLQLADGAVLSVRDWPVPEGLERRGSIVIVHGLGEHSGRYAHVSDRLAGMGLAVRGYDLRGHGRSDGPRGVIPHPDALLDDFRAVFDDLRRDGEPPFVLGHSMGGAIAARAVTGGWVAPRGLVLSSPALRVGLPWFKAAGMAVARRLAPDLGLPNRLPLHMLSHDERVVEDYRSDPLNHDRITPRLYDFLADAGAAARRDAARVTVPTLVLVAGIDRLVDAEGAREFAAALLDGVGTQRVYDDLYHELFNEREPERRQVLDELCGWLEERLS